MKVIITRGTMRNGIALNVGDVLDMPDNEAVTFKVYGQAELYVEPAKPKEETIRVQQPEIINRDPQIEQSTKRKGR